MGIIRNQSIKNSISFYIGMAIGAVNTVLIYPNVFNDQPEHWGLLSILVAYATLISTFSSLGIPKTFIRFFPGIKEKGQLYFLSLITPLFGFSLSCFGYWIFNEELFELLNASPLLQENFFYIFLLVFFISFYDVLTSISRSYLDASTPIFLNEIFLKLYCLIILLFHGFKFIDFTTFLQFYVGGFLFKFLLLSVIQVFKGNIFFVLSLGALKIKEIIVYGFYVLIGGASENNFEVSLEKPSQANYKTLHKTIKKVEEEIERHSFNTVVSTFMICINELTEQKCNSKEIITEFTILLSSYAPHISEEIWQKLGNETSVTMATFPVFNTDYLVENEINYPVSFNGKMRFKITLPAEMTKEEVEAEVLKHERTAHYLEGKSPKKVIVVPKRIVNIVI